MLYVIIRYALNKFEHKVAYHHVLKLYFETRVLFITSHIRYKTEFNTDDKKA